MLKQKMLFVILAVALATMLLTACGAKDVTKPGKAVNLTGDAVAGKQIFDGYCKSCHGPDGTGGVANPGSADGTVPELEPIDEEEFGTVLALDLVIEHGSTPEGEDTASKMPAFGDEGSLKPQQIADVIAYILSINK
jgi:cytochrome c oxidase cbb3-type subunit 3